ncbi:NADH dehydrogenase [ubiquinone] 1 beta subcomplex subunit 7 isoform X1 [Lathamus discolor]|uniref:NADH dehydrogenase [ubiquinone] 1 beta subcomplex subunit 7 isoform X1 n=1 Tax=Lathamus discolor TaxID=678569 RepID=UPI0032B7D037
MGAIGWLWVLWGVFGCCGCYGVSVGAVCALWEPWVLWVLWATRSTSHVPPPRHPPRPMSPCPSMVASPEVLAAARLPLEQRDFCAHHLVKLLRCKRDAFPEPWRCRDLQHHWEACQHRDYVMRMKEFERERRLLQRQKRRQLREEAAAEHA